MLQQSYMLLVETVSVNPVDYKIAKGWMSGLTKIKTFPHIIGRDCAGTIIAVGSNVSELKIGMKVAGMVADGTQTGTFGEYALLPEKCVAELPEKMSFVDAGGMPVVGNTSYQSLVDKGKLKKGDKVIIFGGSTATGILGIQIVCKFIYLLIFFFCLFFVFVAQTIVYILAQNYLFCFCFCLVLLCHCYELFCLCLVLLFALFVLFIYLFIHLFVLLFCYGF